MLKKQIEALVFAVQDGLTTKEIAEKLGKKEEDIEKICRQLSEEYNDRGFRMIFESNKWKMIIEPEMTELVKEVTPMEMPKSIVKTLATIAYFNPAIQSDIIKIRGNKAYEHIKELERRGFITSKPFGKTNKLKLTDIFFEYFDIKRGEEKYLFKERKTKNIGD